MPAKPYTDRKVAGFILNQSEALEQCRSNLASIEKLVAPEEPVVTSE